MRGHSGVYPQQIRRRQPRGSECHTGQDHGNRSERRVLSHGAAGHRNTEIAWSMCVAIRTVRKHLEHAYRKLGVTNRIAAIARMRGCDQRGFDMQERLNRYA